MTAPTVFFSNYDYSGPEKSTENSPGRGLFQGWMGKYKSVMDFRNKKKGKKKKKKRANFIFQLSKMANEFMGLVKNDAFRAGVVNGKEDIRTNQYSDPVKSFYSWLAYKMKDENYMDYDLNMEKKEWLNKYRQQKWIEEEKAAYVVGYEMVKNDA